MRGRDGAGWPAACCACWAGRARRPPGGAETDRRGRRHGVLPAPPRDQPGQRATGSAPRRAPRRACRWASSPTDKQVFLLLEDHDNPKAYAQLEGRPPRRSPSRARRSPRAACRGSSSRPSSRSSAAPQKKKCSSKTSSSVFSSGSVPGPVVDEVVEPGLDEPVDERLRADRVAGLVAVARDLRRSRRCRAG